MPSPMPGMDPWLEAEAVWPTFDLQFVQTLHRMLLPGLPDRYRASMHTRTYSRQMALFTSIIRDEYTDNYIEIRLKGDERLVTLVDVISPTNRTSPEGRQAVQALHADARLAGASIVEIDLCMTGTPIYPASRDTLPEKDHVVTVIRSNSPEHFELYGTTLRKRLPRFRVPLVHDERDTVVDLQACLTRCYDISNYRSIIDYSGNPPGRFDDETSQWIRTWIKQLRV